MFNWRRYLDIADALLVQLPDDEAAQRAAISRAYYAVFGVARDYLRAGGMHIVQTGRAHDQVWSAFGQSPRGIRQHIAQEGRRLKRRREHADYDGDYANLALDAQRWTVRARKLIQHIDDLP